MSTSSLPISKYNRPFRASQCSGRKPGMWRIGAVFDSMEGIPLLAEVDSLVDVDSLAAVDSAAATQAVEQTINETTIMVRTLSARGNFSSMGETSGSRHKKTARKVHAAAPANNFSAAYFRKFYLNAPTRSLTPPQIPT